MNSLMSNAYIVPSDHYTAPNALATAGVQHDYVAPTSLLTVHAGVLSDAKTAVNADDAFPLVAQCAAP